MMDKIDQLRQPFDTVDIEWRIQSQGVKNDKPWCMVLAYVQARAIQERLDHVFGFSGWQVEYRADGKNIICRISIKEGSEWIVKEDGAPETAIESFKGGISSALKRCASAGLGIGRYLYNLETQFAETTTTKPSGNGWNKAYFKEKNLNYWWKVPELPSWALPSNNKTNPEKEAKKAQSDESSTGEADKSVIPALSDENDPYMNGDVVESVLNEEPACWEDKTKAQQMIYNKKNNTNFTVKDS